LALKFLSLLGLSWLLSLLGERLGEGVMQEQPLPLQPLT
jgi:hypothetical protein